MQKTLIILTTILFCSGFWGCKKIHWDQKEGRSSSAKGIENLSTYKPFGSDVPPYCGNKIDDNAPARFKDAINHWASTLTLTTKGNEKEKLRDAVKQTVANLTAAQIEMLSWMNMDLVIHDGPPPVCKSSTRKAQGESDKVVKEFGQKLTFSEANHFACVHSQGGRSRPAIHIGGNPKLVDQVEKMSQQESFVRRLLVRNIGMVFARYFPMHLNAWARSFGDPTSIMSRAQKMAASRPPNEKQRLLNASQMLADSIGKVSGFDKAFQSRKAELYQKLFDTQSGDGLGKSEASQHMERLVKAGVLPAQDFHDVVYAEVFDTRYCIANGKAVFERTFKNTAQSFAATDAVIWELITHIVPRQQTAQRPKPSTLR